MPLARSPSAGDRVTGRRGFLVKPDPKLVEPCARPGCGHPEGDHLICGCNCWHDGEPCACTGFALPAPRCEHCGAVFDATWKYRAHMRFRPVACVSAERRAAAVAEAKLRAREHRTQAGV